MVREDSHMSSLDQTRRQLIQSELMTAETVDSQIACWRDETGAPEDAPGEPD